MFLKLLIIWTDNSLSSSGMGTRKTVLGNVAYLKSSLTYWMPVALPSPSFGHQKLIQTLSVSSEWVVVAADYLPLRTMVLKDILRKTGLRIKSKSSFSLSEFSSKLIFSHKTFSLYSKLIIPSLSIQHFF